MPYPDYDQLANALLAFIFLNGGERREVTASSSYEPLADFFRLSTEERKRQRPDRRPGAEWHNKVQWTRQRLINHGLVCSSRHGFWALTEAGTSQASMIANRYSVLKVVAR